MRPPRKYAPKGPAPILTEEVRHQILLEVKLGVTPFCAAKKQGVSKQLWSLWKSQAEGEKPGRREEPYRSFFRDLYLAEAEYQIILEMSVMNGAAKDARLARAILKSRWPEEWGEAGKDLPPLPPESKDPGERLETRLEEIRRLRQRAERDGSYVAATSLILQEVGLLDKIDAYQTARTEQERLRLARESGSIDLATERIREMVAAMPETLLATLRDAISSRVSRLAATSRLGHSPEVEEENEEGGEEGA